MYNKITQTDIDALRALLTDPERVFSGGDIAEEYSHDELASTKVMPDVVCKCMSAAEVSAVMNAARRGDRAGRGRRSRQRRDRDRCFGDG